MQINFGNEEDPVYTTAIGRATFEGVRHSILDTDIDLIDFTYSTTVNKGQSSHLKRVIVPLLKSRVFDRTFDYTALTSAQTQVILIWDGDAARAAVKILQLPLVEKSE